MPKEDNVILEQESVQERVIKHKQNAKQEPHS